MTDSFRRTVGRTYVPCLVAIVLAWALTISDGFLGGICLLIAYLAWLREYRTLFRVSLALTLVIPLVFVISPYAADCFGKHIFQGSVTDYYNVYFGAKFGYMETGAASATQQAAGALGPKGYLFDALSTIRRHPLIGVGYVPGVKTGDSMLVHLMVVSGAVGSAFFAVALAGIALLTVREIRSIQPQNRAPYHALALVLLIYTVFGISFPTFIQDRSADLLWWLTGILLLNRRPPREIMEIRHLSIVI